MATSIESGISTNESFSKRDNFSAISDQDTREFVTDLAKTLEEVGTPIYATNLAQIIHDDYHPYGDSYNIGVQMLDAVKRFGGVTTILINEGKRQRAGFDRVEALRFGVLCHVRGVYFRGGLIREEIFQRIIQKAELLIGQPLDLAFLESEEDGQIHGTIFHSNGHILDAVQPIDVYESGGPPLNEPTDLELQHLEEEMRGIDTDFSDSLNEDTAREMREDGRSKRGYKTKLNEGPTLIEELRELKKWGYYEIAELNRRMIDYSRDHAVVVDSFSPSELGIPEFVAHRLQLAALHIYERMFIRYLQMIGQDNKHEDKMRFFALMYDPRIESDTIEGFRKRIVELVLSFLGMQKKVRNITLAEMSIFGWELEEAKKEGSQQLSSQSGEVRAFIGSS